MLNIISLIITAGNRHGTGRVRQGQAYGVLKTELRFEDRIDVLMGKWGLEF